MFAELVDSMILRGGIDCTVQDALTGDIRSSTAYITPMKYKYKSFADMTYEDSGAVDGQYYLYLGKASVDLSRFSPGSVVVCNNIYYRIDSAEMYYYCEEALYCRAVLKRYKGGHG